MDDRQVNCALVEERKIAEREACPSDQEVRKPASSDIGGSVAMPRDEGCIVVINQQ